MMMLMAGVRKHRFVARALLGLTLQTAKVDQAINISKVNKEGTICFLKRNKTKLHHKA